MKEFFSRELFLCNFYNDFDIMEKLGQGKYAKVKLFYNLIKSIFLTIVILTITLIF